MMRRFEGKVSIWGYNIIRGDIMLCCYVITADGDIILLVHICDVIYDKSFSSLTIIHSYIRL